MKNWFRRNGGYLGGVLFALLGVAGITSICFSPGFIEGFIGVVIGTIGTFMGSCLIQDQREKNKLFIISTKNDLKFEDKTQDDYSKEQQIESSVRYTKNYIIEESKSNDKEDDLTK